ncbi:MAG: RluA family pseudouridine synthase [Planctomycetes bacterium]|nr:RluA family pseudouridine synthase [Planctomycetota bacterium]
MTDDAARGQRSEVSGQRSTLDPQPSTPIQGLGALNPFDLVVEARAHGWRIDHWLSRLFPNFSRELFKKAVRDERVLVNGLPVKAARRLRVNDRVTVALPDEADRSLPAEDLPLDVLYEDEWIVVVNKAAGMITHPGRGNYRGTLAGGLQFHFDRLSDAGGSLRPGIVHRLDRDTTGLLVVAKNNPVHHRLSGQFERREVRKEYRAIVRGELPLDADSIETHLRVDRRHREKMCICGPGEGARHAATSYEVLERFGRFTWVKLLPKTGRTHQLRVHMQYLACPIVADRLYGGGADLRLSQIRETPPEEDRVLISRQALHAFRLTFRHPESGLEMQFEAPLPEDIERTLSALRSCCGAL